MLIDDAVNPFIKKAREEKMVNDFFLMLNFESGDNIRISFHIDPQNMREFLINFDAYFKKFLSAFPSETKLRRSGTLKYFMDFPVNSVQYNVFLAPPIERIPDFSQEITKLRELFSAFLSNRRILSSLTEDRIYELSVLVHFVFIKAFFEDQGVARKALTEIIQSTLSDAKYIEVLAQLEKKFNKSKDMFFALRDKAWDDTYSPIWSGELTACCLGLKGKGLQFLEYASIICSCFDVHFDSADGHWFATPYLCYQSIACNVTIN